MLYTPIHVASLCGHIEMLDILLDKKIVSSSENLDELVDKDGNTSLHLACQSQSYFSCKVAQRLFKYCSLTAQNKTKSQTPLHIACESGHLTLIKLLLNRLRSLNINSLLVDCDKNTLLHVAVEGTSSLEVVTAVVDVVQPVHKNSEGETPIHIACKNGDLDIVCLLIAKAVEIVFADNGNSYLHSACFGKSLDVVKYLIKKSELDFASLMCQNSDGNTPLHCACITGDHDIVCYLMERASEYAQTVNNEGLTPFCCLLSSGHHRIVEYILLSDVFNKNDLVEVEIPLLHLVINNLKDPKLVFDFVSCIVDKKISDPLKCDSKSNSILHSFLLQIPNWRFELVNSGQLEQQASELWNSFLNIPKIQLCAQNENGDTPLHTFVQLHMYSRFFHYESMLEAYLDRAVSLGVDLANLKNNNGKTAIQLANHKTTQVLIKYGANPGDVLDLYSDILSRSKKNHPLNSSTKIVVLGNSEAGKSTLVQAIQSLELPSTEQSQLIEATGSTAGINKINYESKVLGCITFHDFGGQPEFESANAAFLKTKVSIDYPPIFLVVADVSREGFLKQIHYWFSYIRANTPVQLTPHVIIIGSHSDCILESDFQRVKECVNCSMKSDESCTLAHLILLDCRKVFSEAMTDLNQCLVDSRQKLQCSIELDARCHVLMAYLSQWYRGNSEIVFKRIQGRISSVSCSDHHNVLPVATHALLDLLNKLHSGGHITLLNPDNIDHCWVVLDDSVLYKKVNGTLFAPRDQEFSNIRKFPPNNGVFSSDMLKSIFKDSDINLIIAFIIHSELGQKIEDPETVRLIQSAVARESQMDILIAPCSSKVGATNISKVSREEYFFLPSCVKSECPNDVWSNDENSFCWYMKCKVDQFLNQRFLQVLLLRLTFSFATVGTSQLHRKCNIWKNGIHWSTKQGVEVLVEVIEQNSAVILLMKFTEGVEMEGVKFRSEVLKKILETKKDICPYSDIVEMLFPRTFNYPINTQEGPEVSISHIAEAVTNPNSFNIVVDSKSKPHKLSKLLYFEPVVHGLECLWCEEDKNKVVPTEVLAKICQSLAESKEMMKQSEELLGRIKSSKSLTYQELRKLIGLYSIFCDRNPFELASTKEPNPEMYKERLLNLEKIKSNSPMETQQVPVQLLDKQVQAEINFSSSVCSQRDKDITLTMNHVDTILKILIKAKDKYYYIGRGIGIEDADLNEIENKYLPDKDRCLHEMLKRRIRQGGLTRSMLCQSLREELVGRDDVAQEIEADSRNTPPPKRPKYD